MMEYFKKCPLCGRYMNSSLRHAYGVTCTIYSCLCGYSEDTFRVGCDNKTTYIGGDVSDRTVD